MFILPGVVAVLVTDCCECYRMTNLLPSPLTTYMSPLVFDPRDYNFFPFLKCLLFIALVFEIVPF